MPISIKLLAGGLAGAALLVSAGAALAEPGQATASVNVRSGPGVGYAVLDTLYPGEDVDIQRCTGGWCYVVHNGPNGWVSASYLDSDGGGYAPPPPPTVIYEQPQYVPPPIIVRPPPVVSPGWRYRQGWDNRGGWDNRRGRDNRGGWDNRGGNDNRGGDWRRRGDQGNQGNQGNRGDHQRPPRDNSSSSPPPPPAASNSEAERTAAWCKAYPQLCTDANRPR